LAVEAHLRRPHSLFRRKIQRICQPSPQVRRRPSGRKFNRLPAEFLHGETAKMSGQTGIELR